MGVKNDSKLAALLAASQARARGEKPASAANCGSDGWGSITLKKGNSAQGVVDRRRAIQEANGLRILGMDTALRKTGWGVVEICGKQLRGVDCGVVVNPPTSSITDCMRRLNGAIKGLIERYSPDAVAIEGGFYCRNARTAIILGTARGAVLGVLAEAELPVYEYAPRRAKQAVTGRGNASKEQVAAMVANLLKIQVGNLADDSTDALALAICHGMALLNPTAEPEKPI